MDRSKSRTDLLAAGKQRLQQYRQKKKDNKGGSSRGKSSKKSGKPLPEPDAESDATSVTSISTGSSQVTDGNVETDNDSNVVITESLESRSLTSSSAPENVDPPIDSSSVTMAYDTGNESELDSNAKLALQGHAVHENDSEPSAQDQGENFQNDRVDVEKDVSLTISKKSGKPQLPEPDAEADATGVTSISTGSSQVTDGNVETDNDSNVIITESLESRSLTSSPAPENVDPPIDSLSVTMAYDTGNESELDSNATLALQGHGVHEDDSEPSAQDQGENSQNVRVDVEKDVSLTISNSEGETTHALASEPVAVLPPPASVATAAGESVTVEREGEKREKSLLVPEDIPNTFVVHSREDQVTDLGAMQEADGLDMKKSCQSTDAIIDDPKELPLDASQGDQSLSGIAPEKTRIGEATHEAEKLDNPVELISSLQPNQEQVSEGVRSGLDVELHEGLNQLHTLVGSAVDDSTQELSMGASARSSDLSPILDVGSVNLLQLAEIIRGLSEEECQFLVKAREVSDIDPLTSVSVLPDHDFSVAYQRLKEELFLANLMKNIFHTELAEQLELQSESDNRHYKLIGELSQLHDSHNEVNENNQRLSEELANCRVELHNSSSKCVELQNQFNTSMAEVEALSARVVELQIDFEISQKDSLDLSTELADCRSLISGLQDENKGMKETLDLVTGEKNKLAEEKEFHLYENKKLVTELFDLKSSMEGVEIENSNLIDRISLVTEESNKNIAEIQNLLHEVDRLSMDLAENKDLVASLQAENSNLNDSLASSADKIKNLEDENQSLVLENQRLSSHTVALQEQLSIEEGERMRFEADLKEATLNLEQLSKENILLNSTLDEHKTKIEEYGKKHSQPLSQPGDLGNQTHIEWDQSKGLEIAITEDHMHTAQRTDEGEPEGPVVNMPEHEVFNDSIGFVSLETCLTEVEKVLVMLEKAINELHSQSVFSDSSGEKVSSPGVSKLIQAFESKVSEDEQEVEIGDSIDVQSQSNSLIMLTKEQVGNLRNLLSKWKLDVQSAAALFKEERDGRTIGDAKYSNLEDQFAGLKQHFSDLEESNIELAVQYEIAKLHLGDIQEKKCHLEELYEALKQEDMHLKAKNNELYEKLGYCHSKISGLHTDMYDVKQSSNEMASVIGSQLENLQKEVTKRAMLLEQGWNTTITEIVELVGRLNKSVGGTLHTAVSSDARNGLDISHQLEASVNAATEMIFDLQERLEASNSDHEIFSASYKEMTSRCDHLLGRNELAIGVLHKMYCDLKKLMMLSGGGSLDEDKIDEQSEALPDLLNYNSYETMMKHLGDVLNEKLELESVTKEMKSELIHRETELEELKLKCHGLDSVGKLVDDVAGVLNVETPSIEINKSSLSYLHSLVSMLVQKTKEAEIQNDTTKEEFGSKEMKLAELMEKVHYLDTLRLENENEIFILKESLHQAEEALTAARSELQGKANELEHSEQRVSSIREKLGIAVAKGKGLVVQRDGLKQSLAETSSELERCLQELNLKDTRLDELETKLKTYSEAGERAEALESELSYIRNSANALRESFLLKDSMLQRIEEVLEDLDLPEQFHSSDIIEKIDWLVRSVVGNSLPMNDWEQKDFAEGGSLPANDWEQKDSAEGGSYSDAGYVVTDSWKDDSQLLPDPGDDFRKNFEEMQSKYYGLAEQNEMLEQSLMERNSLVQRWEELVDKIDMPSHLRSMEMEDRIEWVGRALAEANHHVDSLQLKIERYESYCGLLNADLEESQRRRSALQGDIRALTSEREHLSGKMEALAHECEKLSVQTRGAELENEKLLNELSSLKDKLEQKAEIEEQMFIIDGKIKELRDLVNDALSESESENLISDGANIDALEELLRKLIENHASLSSMKPTCGVVLDGHHSQNEVATLHEERSIEMRKKEEADVDRYKEDLEAALSELEQLKKEKESNLEKQISLSGEIEALSKRTEELQELLNQEEQKSASAREKLNVAVRKGKALVQQRDSLKETIQKMSVEMEHLKSEINNRESTIAEHEHKLRQLSTYPDRLEALESESLLMKHHLEETEHHLQEKEYSLQLILNKLGEIDVGGAGHVSDPLKKLELVGKLCSDLHGALASSEQESRKSKRASELLLAELNEVQERNDSFQEELAKMATELMDLRRERDAAETAQLETLSHLEKLSALHDEEKKSHYSEIMELKSNMNQVCKGFGEVQNLLANAFFKDLESFRNLEAGLESCMKGNNAANVVDSSLSKEHDGILRRSSDNKKSFVSGDSWSALGTIDHYNENTIIDTFHLFGHQLQEFLVEVNSLKERIHIHSSVVQEQDKTLLKLMTNIQREITSQRESCENIKKELSEQDLLLVALRGNIACLYESFINSVIVLENGKAELVGEELESSDLEINKTLSFDDEKSQECIKTMADRLLLAAKGFASVKTEFLDANQKEMKATITNLQRELQEKDVQRDRICAELVKQIKDAEAAANSNSQDLKSLRIQEHNLKTRVELIEAEKKILEQRVIELQDKQGTEAELLGDKMRAQTDLLAAKDLEIEALMHALDEEETQMEELTKKNAALEKVVQQKNQEIENLESSRSKVMKKLSVTVSKFDELHHLSESLLSEVEKLQSQLPEKDAEISFLRQEVTRCTNDALLASQLGNQRSSDDVFELLMWVDTIISRDGVDDIHPDVKSDTRAHQYKEILHKKLMSLLSELENLREVAESKDAMLQAERSKVAELNLKAETLEKSLHEKASQLNLLEGVEETGKRIDTSSEITEVEPLVNDWTTTTGAFVTPQVRSLRKGNSDHVAIAVDADPGSTNRIEDEDDDKVHGFKSLTSSKIVPRFTRPVSDLIDGLWVSCDRTLMRQPVLRLGIIIYWAIMHALLAFFVV